MHITFEKLLYREDYQIKLDHIVMNEENGNRLALLFSWSYGRSHGAHR